MAYLMGIDLGTSGTKTVLFDTDGTIVASALREYPLYQPKPGWAEQEPCLLYTSTPFYGERYLFFTVKNGSF